MKNTVVFMAVLVLTIALPALADAPERIGVVSALQGSASAKGENGAVRPLAVRQPLYRNDVITSGPNSRCVLLFADMTTFCLGASSSLRVQQYIAGRAAQFEMQRGTFQMMSGDIARSNPTQFNLTTPTASIGIRGTTTGHNIGADGEMHYVLDMEPGHEVIFSDLLGAAPPVIIDQDLTSIAVNLQGEFGTQQQMTPAQAMEFSGQFEIDNPLAYLPPPLDENGEPVLPPLFDEEGNPIAVYDEEGNLLPPPPMYDADGNLIFEPVYDEEGNLIAGVTYEADAAFTTEDYTLAYDAEGNLIAPPVYDEEGNLITEPTYDAEGNLVAEPLYDAEGNLIAEPIYDEEGNIIGGDFMYDPYAILPPDMYDPAADFTGDDIVDDFFDYGYYPTHMLGTMLVYNATGGANSLTPGGVYSTGLISAIATPPVFADGAYSVIGSEDAYGDECISSISATGFAGWTGTESVYRYQYGANYLPGTSDQFMAWGEWALYNPSALFSDGTYDLSIASAFFVDGIKTTEAAVAGLTAQSVIGYYYGGADGMYMQDGAAPQYIVGSFESTINFGTNQVSGTIIEFPSDGISLIQSGTPATLTSQGTFDINVFSTGGTTTLPGGNGSGYISGACFGPNAEGVGGTWEASGSGEIATGIFDGLR